MASLHYLWSNRVKYKIGSYLFYRSWAKRLMLLPELLRRNNRRMQLIRRGAFIDEIAEIGEVSIEGDKKMLSIGKFSFLGKVYIALHASVKIGERVCINDGVRILTASHDVTDSKWKYIKAEVTIEDYVWIGMDALILPGVRLGRGSVVGARAVVTKSVLPGAVVAGNPAKSLPKSRCKQLNYNPCEFLAANRAWLLG